MLKRLKLFLSMMRYGRAHNRDFAREHFAVFRDLREDLSEYFSGLSGLRVLDVGCGKSCWLTILLHAAGSRVTGIDTEAADPRRTPAKYWKSFRTSGIERTLRTAAWDWLFARQYYAALAECAAKSLPMGQIDSRSMSVTDLHFDDDTFDLIVSHEVFEHINDLPAAAAEVRRVLKPDGLTYIYFHNFASVSGGHHIAWKYPDTEPSIVVPPWDHLRENRFPDIPSWVNRKRVVDYRDAFDPYFDVIQWKPGPTEGKLLLTDEIRQELSDYTEEELLTKGYTIVSRPKKDRIDQALEQAHAAEIS